MGTDAYQKVVRRRSAGRRGVLAGLVLGAALCTGLYCVAAWLGVVGGLWGGGLAPVVPRDASVGLHLCPSGSSAGPECHGVDLEIAHTIRDLRREASTRFPCTAADDNGGGSDEDFEDNACRLFDADGLELTSEQQLSGLTNGSQLHVVKGDNHFFWPTVRLGYRWRPKHVHSPNPDKPIEMETLSESPRVFLIDNFLSDAEVEYLVAHAEGRLERSHVGIGKETFHNQRTSKTAWDTGSATSLTIQKRGYDLVRQPWNKKTTDAIQVIKYDKGQMYLLHTDYFKVGYQNLDPSKPDGTNRIVTIFMYLSDVDAGGATVFPHARKHAKVQDDRPIVEHPPEKLQSEINHENVKMAQCSDTGALQVHPKKGRAILFYNQLPDGTTDINAEHGGCPVAEGQKWAANVWIWNRERPRFGSGGKQLMSRRKRKHSGGGGLLSRLFGGGDENGHKSHSNNNNHHNSGIKVEFSNERSSPVELFWLRTSDGKEMGFGTLQPHSRMPMNTFEGHTWVVRDARTHQEVKRAVAKAGQGQAIAIE